MSSYYAKAVRSFRQLSTYNVDDCSMSSKDARDFEYLVWYSVKNAGMTVLEAQDIDCNDCMTLTDILKSVPSKCKSFKDLLSLYINKISTMSSSHTCSSIDLKNLFCLSESMIMQIQEHKSANV